MTINIIDLLDHNIEDPVVRENFEKLRNFLNDRQLISSTVKILEVQVKNPSSDYAIIHGLGFKPKDVIITGVSKGTATVNHSSTTNTQLSINVSDESTVRLLVGSFGT
jgi:hypothetical protein